MTRLPPAGKSPRGTVARRMDTLPSLEQIRAGLRAPPGRTRESVAAARAACKGTTDWRVAWERCVARELLPLAWGEPPWPIFTDRRGLASETTPSAVAAIAADARGVATAVAFAGEWTRRLEGLGVTDVAFRGLVVVDGVSFLFDRYNLLLDPERAALIGVMRPVTLEIPGLGIRNTAGTSESMRVYGALQWAENKPRAPNPFAPAVTCYALGYTFELRHYGGDVPVCTLRVPPLPRK